MVFFGVGLNINLELNGYRVVGVLIRVVRHMIIVYMTVIRMIGDCVPDGDVITYETSNEKFQVRPYTLGYAFRV